MIWWIGLLVTDWDAIRKIPDPTQLPDSLAYLLSSPERYARALDMTVDEMKKREDEYANLTQKLFEDIQPLSGEEKHVKLCQFRFDHGRHPFVCRKCWTYLPICVCGRVSTFSAPVDTILWTHDGEYGRTSNTGVVLRESIENCRMLIKGLPEHDAQMDQLLSDPSRTPVLLWPKNEKGNDVGTKYISMEELRCSKGVTLIALEGTWRNARRMLQRLGGVKRLDLEFKEGSKSSILAPLRAQGAQGGEHNMCTAEAVLTALQVLGMNREHVSSILDLTKVKIDLTIRYRGKCT